MIRQEDKNDKRGEDINDKRGEDINDKRRRINVPGRDRKEKLKARQIDKK